ncbi:MAG: AAA domain-containing protein [Lysobacter sp.]|nr:AAA domain-containing protein [Lysobacter sp.]
MEPIGILVGALLGAGAVVLARRLSGPKPAKPGASGAPADVAAAATSDAATPGAASDARAAAQDRILQIRREFESLDATINDPRDMLAQPIFEEGVALLASDAFTAQELVDHIGLNNWALSPLAVAALSRRNDVDAVAVLKSIDALGAFPMYFVFDWLRGRDDVATLIPLLLPHARDWWWERTGMRQRVREFVGWMRQRGVEPDVAQADVRTRDLDVLAEQRTAFVAFEEPYFAPWITRLDAAIAQARQRHVLGAFGRIRAAADDARRIAHPDLVRQVGAVHERIAGARPKPQLLVGDHGVGKTVLGHALADRLLAEGWTIFEANASDVLANQKYIGELEGRVREMLEVLREPRTAWFAGDLLDLLHKGAHNHDPRGILDLVLPAIERGELLLVAEATPKQFAQLALARPTIKHHFDVHAIAPADATSLPGILALWADAATQRLGVPVADSRTLAEAMRMASQFFPEQQEPGRSLRLLDDMVKVAVAETPPALPLDDEDVLAAVAARSGLPMDVIDDRQSLDLDHVRAAFRKRVLGQDEAIDCLVDRMAMLKAGLVDAGRPIGVFLFAGPTGTGKTEVAKALGEMLFGSDERLLRLDMSEYQTEDAAWRLLGDSADRGARSLTQRIREQPFSVVLLDEFEKAHPKVWDLFLQVFDDGRLSDRTGHVADFRHAIIILTTNVGSTIARNAGPGFTASRASYSRSAVEKALFETFRREFLNRLDRIVLFQPLDRSLMREILHKELRQVLERRGLRNRDWAVEWEPSAIEFLLDRGFTPDLGARPLRRAIEHHLLAPLARRIVEHRAPQGGQFLFVRSDGDALVVEFVDPDADATPVAGGEARASVDLRALLFDATPNDALRRDLDAACVRVRDTIEGDAWRQARDADYARMAHPAFWDDATRFVVLDRIERRDRIESALEAAERLLRRWTDGHAPASLPQSLTQLLFLLEIAVGDLVEDRPQDALLHVALGEADRRGGIEAAQWWQSVLGMYLAWARRRNMRVDVLRRNDARCEALIAVSGFGALHLLASEAGLHVFEDSEDDGHRRTVQVRVAPDGPGRAREVPAAEDMPRIARRYRGGASPLVRDATRGWRSGRLDRVLDGDFDVMQ